MPFDPTDLVPVFVFRTIYCHQSSNANGSLPSKFIVHWAPTYIHSTICQGKSTVETEFFVKSHVAYVLSTARVIFRSCLYFLLCIYKIRLFPVSFLIVNQDTINAPFFPCVHSVAVRARRASFPRVNLQVK